MKNLNNTVYAKILLQTDEAKELGFNKLAERVLSVMGPYARDEKEEVTYAFTELEADIHNKLWKMAIDVMTYHDVQSVDIQKIDEAITSLAHVAIKAIENTIDSESKVGPLEPLLPGESRQCR